MSFNPEELEEHCQTILKDPRIKNRIVILCEGDLPKIQGRRSPQSYKQMEHLPDANFYKACVPRPLNQYLPVFFNCGDRSCVLKAYFRLIELHQENNKKSYLNPDTLFAIVDLDNQDKIFEEYSFPSINSIYNNLYQEYKVNENNAPNHKIWVTGLIHKEAYFIIPELQDLFDKHINLPLYKNQPVSLERIYRDMIASVLDDIDIEKNFQTVQERINHLFSDDITTKEQLKDSWLELFNQVNNQEQKEKLIFALLTIKKAKNFWQNIQPPNDVSTSPDVFQEQLSLQIARQFYATKLNNPKYHIPYCLETIQKISALSS